MWFVFDLAEVMIETLQFLGFLGEVQMASIRAESGGRVLEICKDQYL